MIFLTLAKFKITQTCKITPRSVFLNGNAPGSPRATVRTDALQDPGRRRRRREPRCGAWGPRGAQGPGGLGSCPRVPVPCVPGPVRPRFRVRPQSRASPVLCAAPGAPSVCGPTARAPQQRALAREAGGLGRPLFRRTWWGGGGAFGGGFWFCPEVKSWFHSF